MAKGAKKPAVGPLTSARVILQRYLQRLDAGVNLTATKGSVFHEDLRAVDTMLEEAMVEGEDGGG